MSESREVESRLKVWVDRVEASDKKPEWKRGLKTIKQNQKWAAGQVGEEITDSDQVESQSVRANLIHATNQGMLPHIYAKNPEPSVQPARWVGTDHKQLPAIRKFAETAEIVLDTLLTKAGLKRECKTMVRAIQTSRLGCLKLTYHRDKYKDPMVQKDIEDTQETLASMEKDLRKIEEGTADHDEIEAMQAEFVDKLNSLRERVEVIRAEGFVLESIPIKRMVFDSNLTSLADYKQGRYMGYWSYMTTDRFMEQFPDVSEERVKMLRAYSGKPDDEGQMMHGPSDQIRKESLVKVYEIWSKDTNSVYNWGEGDTDFAREPFQPSKTGERFYPFFVEGHHWVDGKYMPLSDVELLIQLQKEYDDLRKQFSEHREANIPTVFADASELDRNSIRVFSEANGVRVVAVDLAGGNIQQKFQPAPTTNLNPALYDTGPILTDMQWVSGQQDADRGA